MARLSSSLLLLLGHFSSLASFSISSAFLVQNTKFAKTQTTNSKRATFLAATSLESTTLDSVLETLDKRFEKGNISNEEKKDVIAASDVLLKQLNQLKSTKASTLQYSNDELQTAITEMDTAKVTNILSTSGMSMDEETVNLAFWSVVKSIEVSESNSTPLSSNVTQMIHHIFDADFQHLLTREKTTQNVTCMQPDESGGVEAKARRMNYIFDDGDHKNLPLTEGRKCEDGQCCEACSRNIFPTFATDIECNLKKFPELSSLTFNDLVKVGDGTILQFVRLVERVRRTIAHEYGLPLSIVLPLQAYSRKYQAGLTQKGGGGGEGDSVTLHTDEATHSGYHYSCVIYLSTQGVDFEGGNFVFNDPAEVDEDEVERKRREEEKRDKENDQDLSALMEALKRGEELPELDYALDDDVVEVDDDGDSTLEEELRTAGRDLTPFHPTRGSAVIFSSGWENMHEVNKITSGTRYAIPCFFTTCPVPEAHYQQMNVGKPKTDKDIADDWLHLLFAHRMETPVESVGRVKELLMKWHYMCTPLTKDY